MLEEGRECLGEPGPFLAVSEGVSGLAQVILELNHSPHLFLSSFPGSHALLHGEVSPGPPESAVSHCS